MIESSMSQNQSSVASFPRVVVPPCFIHEPSVVENWRYEDRRNAQQLLEHLWIGPLGLVKNEQFLLQHNIRILISLMSNNGTAAVVKHRYMNSSHFKCFVVDLGHSVTNMTKIVSELPRIIDAINYASYHGCSALVFCETGNGPSAVAGAAYMIDQKRMSVISAVQYVQSKRFSVHFNDTDLYNLGTFSSLVQARTDASQRRQIGCGSRITREREMNEDIEDEYRATKRR